MKVRRSNRLAIDFTLPSKAASRSREIRNAAFMIILSPIGLLIREVEHEDEDISRLKKEISGQKGPTYFARMQYGRLIDSALQSRSERYVAEILDQLRDVSVASRINKPIGDKMIMNAAFLIARDQEAAFDAKVKLIATRFDKLTFKYTGPWPPYNFVNIRLKLERA